MNRFKALLLILYTILIVFVVRFLFAPQSEGGQITDKTPVQSNIIERDYSSLDLQICKADLTRYDTETPYIDIQSAGNGDYMLKASLCERRWQKLVNIKPRDSPRNMTIAGPYIDTSLRVGAWGQYYRLYGKFGLGGGFMLSQGFGALQGGVLYMW
jgi:hypothetical protein